MDEFDLTCKCGPDHDDCAVDCQCSCHCNTYIDSPMRQRLDWLHSLMQELEQQGVELPMGDFSEVYSIIEDAREAVA